MRREFEVLSKLSAIYPQAPKPLLFCDDESVIGSQFYLMQRRRGLIIRGDTAPQRVSSPTVRQGAAGPSSSSDAVERLHTDQDHRLQVCRSFIVNLADMHALDYKAAGLQDLAAPRVIPRDRSKAGQPATKSPKPTNIRSSNPPSVGSIRTFRPNPPPPSSTTTTNSTT
jgi:aminoglycoside phosphotransferase (APT) family kinase protein